MTNSKFQKMKKCLVSALAGAYMGASLLLPNSAEAHKSEKSVPHYHIDNRVNELPKGKFGVDLYIVPIDSTWGGIAEEYGNSSRYQEIFQLNEIKLPRAGINIFNSAKATDKNPDTIGAGDIAIIPRILDDKGNKYLHTHNVSMGRISEYISSNKFGTIGLPGLKNKGKEKVGEAVEMFKKYNEKNKNLNVKTENNLEKEIISKQIININDLNNFNNSGARYKVGFGVGNETTLNASVDWKVGENFRLGTYASANISGSSKTESNTIVTNRERELIGAGTYAERTDEITTQSETTQPFEVGVRGSKRVRNNLEVFLTAGLGYKQEKQSKSGTATIAVTRNDEEVDRRVIGNSVPGETSNGFVPSVGAGIEYNLTKVLSTGVLAKHKGGETTGSVFLNLNF